MSPTYMTWQGMIGRCHVPTNSGFAEYGGRGIVVCKRWRTFENFLADMGERPDGTTIERERNNLGYFKSNCRWATPKEQANNKTNSRRITYGGVTMTLAQWCEEAGLPYFQIHTRLKRGWSFAEAIGRPLLRSRRGCGCGSGAKLSDFDRMMIICAYPEVSQSELARNYSVSQRTIWNTINMRFE